MRAARMLGAGLLALLGGCQACSDCTDYSPPATFTSPGEVYAGRTLPASSPVVPQVLPPGAGRGEPIPAQPIPGQAKRNTLRK